MDRCVVAQVTAKVKNKSQLCVGKLGKTRKVRKRGVRCLHGDLLRAGRSLGPDFLKVELLGAGVILD